MAWSANPRRWSSAGDQARARRVNERVGIALRVTERGLVGLEREINQPFRASTSASMSFADAMFATIAERRVGFAHGVIVARSAA